MSTAALFATLEKLYKLNKSLLDLSLNKTNVIKRGDIKALDDLLNDEQKHVAAISTLESERQRLSAAYLKEKGFQTEINPTLSQCIEHGSPEEQQLLENWQNKLVPLIGQLKDQNELNQQLVHQSLQFVNLNLSILQPQESQTTYTRPNGERKRQATRPMFDSKA